MKKYFISMISLLAFSTAYGQDNVPLITCTYANLFDSHFSFNLSENEKKQLVGSWGESTFTLSESVIIERGYIMATKLGDGCLLRFSANASDGSSAILNIGIRPTDLLRIYDSKGTLLNEFFTEVKCESNDPERLKQNLKCGTRDYLGYHKIDRLKDYDSTKDIAPATRNGVGQNASGAAR